MTLDPALRARKIAETIAFARASFEAALASHPDASAEEIEEARAELQDSLDELEAAAAQLAGAQPVLAAAARSAAREIASVERRYARASLSVDRPRVRRGRRAPRRRVRSAVAATVVCGADPPQEPPPERDHHRRSRRALPERHVDLRAIPGGLRCIPMKATTSPDRERRAVQLAEVKPVPADRRRALRPRAPMALRVSFVSQENCLAILGIVPRKFREVIVPRCAHVTRIGKTALVPIDEAEQAVMDLGTCVEPEAGHDQGDDDEGQPRSVDDVLARIGREVAR
jgi:hypothetical protein